MSGETAVAAPLRARAHRPDRARRDHHAPLRTRRHRRGVSRIHQQTRWLHQAGHHSRPRRGVKEDDMTANPYPEERKWYDSPKSTKRALGDDPAPAPSHTRSHVPANYRDVNGWGVDLNNRPMFPRELPSDVTTVRGEVRDWQGAAEKGDMSRDE